MPWRAQSATFVRLAPCTDQATARIVVNSGGVASAPVQVDVWPGQPGVFTWGGFAGAIQHSGTYAPATAANRARRGEIVVVYARASAQ